MEETIKHIISRIGELKHRATTDDKLRSETKKHIDNRSELRRTGGGKASVRIELAELNKLIKKRIREDCTNYDYEQIKRISDENCNSIFQIMFPQFSRKFLLNFS